MIAVGVLDRLSASTTKDTHDGILKLRGGLLAQWSFDEGKSQSQYADSMLRTSGDTMDSEATRIPKADVEGSAKQYVTAVEIINVTVSELLLNLLQA